MHLFIVCSGYHEWLTKYTCFWSLVHAVLSGEWSCMDQPTRFWYLYRICLISSLKRSSTSTQIPCAGSNYYMYKFLFCFFLSVDPFFEYANLYAIEPEHQIRTNAAVHAHISQKMSAALTSQRDSECTM